MLDGVILVNAKGIELLLGSDEICLGVIFGIRSLLQCAERNRAMVIKIFGADVCLVGQDFVVTGLYVCIEGIGDIRALYLDQELSFFHVVIEAGADIHDPPAGQRDDGNFPVDIGVH
jgi:hypothetical protein